VNAQQLVAQYELLSTISGEMRTAADQGEWDKLIELEDQCSHHITNMQLVEQNSVLDELSLQH